MKERIKKLRKTLGLTQQQFADRLGIGRGNIATYESRDSNLSDAVIMLICRTFNVSETWLRTGAGEMFEQVDAMADMEKKLREVLKDRPDSLREKVITALLNLDEECWDVVEKFTRELVEAHEKESQEDAERARKGELAALMARDPADLTDEEYEVYMREYRRQLLEQKKAGERSSDTTSA